MAPIVFLPGSVLGISGTCWPRYRGELDASGEAAPAPGLTCCFSWHTHDADPGMLWGAPFVGDCPDQDCKSSWPQTQRASQPRGCGDGGTASQPLRLTVSQEHILTRASAGARTPAPCWTVLLIAAICSKTFTCQLAPCNRSGFGRCS